MHRVIHIGLLCVLRLLCAPFRVLNQTAFTRLMISYIHNLF